MPPSTISALVSLGRLLRLTLIPTFFSLQVITSLPVHPIVFSSDALASPAVVNHTTFDDLRLRSLGCAIAGQHNLMILDQFECFFEERLMKLLSGEEKDPHSVTTKRLWEEESKSSPK
ncbi:hypothetical protein IGI04_038367 [Brassica rapa subsp. trilocularis]|uniref:Uncharacterized protein n=1 Tax=Brassica rapa subsp. trilocularis TaxID=1813537 RepID=A0ABQ7LK14_BRACM|nr:hypothetical protein IGI04_038367 [Brassica rapa subsp. trilocularis]